MVESLKDMEATIQKYCTPVILNRIVWTVLINADVLLMDNGLEKNHFAKVSY